VDWTCSRCGAPHEGLPLDWAFDAPAYWSPEYESSERGTLSEDLCVIQSAEGTDYFIRGVLEIPVHDANESFVYGVWTTLSEGSFKRAVELWDDPCRVEEPPYFGWMANSLVGYPETLNLKANVQTRELDLRPFVELEPIDHPLAQEQHQGITMARVREIAELNLHGAV
jgi:hypothetical protein